MRKATQTPPPATLGLSTVADDLYYDEDETDCPLCLEEMADSDRLFKPCPCGYQICRFCYHRIREEIDGKCPACRRQYLAENAVTLPMSAIKLKVKAPKAAATSTPVTAARSTGVSATATPSQTTTAKRSLVSENPNLVLPHRRHLIDLRVIQRNLVYVIGISPRIATETILRDMDWFGQCGRIVKVVVNRRNLLESATPTNAGPSASAYITYARVEDAAKALAHWDGYLFDGRVMRASYGTTKYCSYFLRGISCPNAGCMYLHEEGQEGDSFTKEQLQREKERAKETPVKEPEKPVVVATAPLPPFPAPPVELPRPVQAPSPPLESTSLFGEASSFLQRLASRFGERQTTQPSFGVDLDEEDVTSVPSSTAPIPVSFAFLSDEGEVEYTASSLGRRPSSSTQAAPSTSILADIWSRSQASHQQSHHQPAASAYFDDPAVMMARPASSHQNWDPVVLPPGIVNPSPMMTMSVPASQRHHFVPPSPAMAPTVAAPVQQTQPPPPPEPKTVVATPLVVSMKPSAAANPTVVTVTATSQPKVFYQTATKKPTTVQANVAAPPVQPVPLPPSNPSSIKTKSTVKTTIITATPPPSTKTKQVAKKSTPTANTTASTASPATNPATPANPFSLLMAPVEESDESSEVEEQPQPQVEKKKQKAADTAKKTIPAANKKRQHEEGGGWTAEEREAFNAQVEAIRSIPLNSLSLPDLVRHIELLDGLCERSRADQERLEAQLRALLAPIH